MLTTQPIRRSIIPFVIACALAAPAASGAQTGQDMRGPDARDAEATSSLAGTTSATYRHELEQPLEPVRFYGPAPASDVPADDLRSPDARDSALGRGTFNSPDVTVVKLSTPARTRADRGVDWGDAGFGAAILLGALAVGLAGTTAIAHRRRHRPPTATTA